MHTHVSIARSQITDPKSVSWVVPGILSTPTVYTIACKLAYVPCMACLGTQWNGVGAVKATPTSIRLGVAKQACGLLNQVALQLEEVVSTTVVVQRDLQGWCFSC